jgi:NAD(P)-dependent dehydrogenase (short-subunit alcohol dehydrogenase family)
MSNPIVLITGALTGIGRATALAFGREGARLIVSGRREDAGEALVAELRAQASRQILSAPTYATKTTSEA